MSAPNRKGTTGSYTEGVLLFTALGILAVGLGGTWAAAHWGAKLAGTPVPPGHPLQLATGLTQGEVPWPVESTLVATALGGLVLVVAALAAVLVARAGKNRTRVDKAAAHMGRGKALDHLSTPGARRTADASASRTPSGYRSGAPWRGGGRCGRRGRTWWSSSPGRGR